VVSDIDAWRLDRCDGDVSATDSTLVDVHGTCEPGFEQVSGAFAENFRSRGDIGAAVSVIVDGRRVVDLWGGSAAPGTPWQRDTIVNVWSSTKGVVALAVQMLVDRGHLDLDAPVATYWPEFAAGSKAEIPVRYLLSHRAGLSGARTPLAIQDLPDWEKVIAALEASEPWWTPGTASGYHALTFGYLVGEVIRRVSRRSVGRFVAEEIAGPLDADLKIGLGDDDIARCAILTMDAPPPDSANAAMFAQLDPAVLAALANPSMAPPAAADIANADAWRRAEIPAANGHATATGLATVYAVLAQGGEHGGVRLLSPEAAERIREGQGRGVDLVLGVGNAGLPNEWALGVILSGPEGLYGPNPRSFGHSGYGGSFGMADPEARLSIGYVMNHMGNNLSGDPRQVALTEAVYACL
jgi:CubicO group peptidase (beta-lactamase class C family)